MFKDTIVVALGTAASRVTGLARVVVLGVILGQTALADAFDGANNSPNSVYELLVGGVLAATLVPLFTRAFKEGDSDAESSVISTSIIVLAATTVLAMVAAPFIFRLYSLQPSNLVDAAQYREAGTQMARVFLAQIFFYGLSALATALLNARRKFAMAAWAPALSNLVTIGFLALIPTTIDGLPTLEDVSMDNGFYWLLTLSSTVGVATMALVLWPSLRRAGFTPRFRPDFGHPAVRSMLKLSAWTLGYVVTNQIALIVIKNLAEPGSGNQDAYSKAFIFFMLPHSLLALSIATTVVPELVHRVADADTDGFASRFTSGLRWIVMLVMPASVLMAVLAHPLILTVLQHGNFGADAALNTSRALTGFAVGLVGFSTYLYALRAFYAHQDTRTPFLVNAFQNVVNIALAVWLFEAHGVLGLGLAFGISYLVAAAVTVWLLHRHHRALDWVTLGPIVVPTTAGAAVMALATWQVHVRLAPGGTVGHLVEVMAAGALGGAGYLAVLWLTGTIDPARLARTVGRRMTTRS